MLKFNEDFIKNYDEEGDIGYFLKVDTECPKELHDLHSDLPFLPERMKVLSATSLNAICMIKKTMLFTSAFKTSIKSWSKTKKSS